MKKAFRLFIPAALALTLVAPFEKPHTVNAAAEGTEAKVGQVYKKHFTVVETKDITDEDFASGSTGRGGLFIEDLSHLIGMESEDPEAVEIRDFKKTNIGQHTFRDGAVADEYRISWTAVMKKPNSNGVSVHLIMTDDSLKGSADFDYVDLYFIKAVDPSVETQMFRLYNPNSGEHFYTSAQKEKDHLVSLGWKDEGTGWYAPVSGTPVYRLYNANGGEHHYTMSEKEKNALVNAGWKDEGTGWYSSDDKGVPVYRQYNPNAFANNHNYTTDTHEKDGLVSLGWKDEGVGWYGTAAGVITQDDE